ncbi:hypothetical protein AUW26_00045 [Streptomyces sp. CC71]|nr:hypothetical protein AUW26_00045 [Streptomyces sp. CC71]
MAGVMLRGVLSDRPSTSAASRFSGTDLIQYFVDDSAEIPSAGTCVRETIIALLKGGHVQ